MKEITSRVIEISSTTSKESGWVYVTLLCEDGSVWQIRGQNGPYLMVPACKPKGLGFVPHYDAWPEQTIDKDDPPPPPEPPPTRLIREDVRIGKKQ